MNIPANLQRRPFLAPIGLLAVAASAALVMLLAAAWVVWLLATSASTLVIVVRHAPQVQGGQLADPPLAAEGEARAAALARALGAEANRLAAIYVTPDLRSRSTVAPLARDLGLVPQVVSAGADSRALAKRVLRAHGGQTVLIVGHAGTVPAIVAAFGGRMELPAMAEADFDLMYVIAVPRIGRPRVLRLRY